MLSQRISFGVTAFLLLMMAAAAWKARDFGALAAYFPISIATAGAIIAALELLMSRRDGSRPPREEAAAEDRELQRHLRGGAWQFAYLAAYLAGIVVLGFFSATFSYLVLALWLGAGFKPLQTVALALATCAALHWGGAYIGVMFPDGIVDRPVLDWLDI